MEKQKKISQSEIDGVEYRRAKTWRIALATMNSGAGMCFYILMGMASYLANAGYGIAVAVTGLILTGTRVLDAFTDPIIAVLIDKLNTRFGKIRILLGLGWLIQTLAVFLLFLWGSSGNFGIVYFILIYIVYIIGYTINSVTGNIMGPVMVNDPKQRPLIGVWATVYSYFVPMILSVIINVVILPRYGNQYSVDMLAMSCLVSVGISFVFLMLAFIGVSDADRPENFRGIQALTEESKVSFVDMAKLFRSNRPFQTYIISAAADKLAQQTGAQAVVNTMLFGILIGNMQLGTIMSLVAMLPSILFAIFGARYAGKHGNKEALIRWTWVCVGVAAALCVFCYFVDLRLVTVSIIPTILFFGLTLFLNGAKMCVTTATGAMCADVIDYELNRTGKFIPAAVTGAYSFVDKGISSLGSTIAAGCVALIGFKTVMPQPTDSPSTGILYMTMFLLYGISILGWFCSLIAMKFSILSKDSMVEVQKNIQERKAEALRAAASEAELSAQAVTE